MASTLARVNQISPDAVGRTLTDAHLSAPGDQFQVLAQADRQVLEQARPPGHWSKERIRRRHIGLRRLLRGFCLLLRDAQGHTGMSTGLQRPRHRRAHGIEVDVCTRGDQVAFVEQGLGMEPAANQQALKQQRTLRFVAPRTVSQPRNDRCSRLHHLRVALLLMGSRRALHRGSILAAGAHAFGAPAASACTS